MFGTTDPVLRTPAAVVCGLNSARPWRHQGGRLDAARLASVAGVLESAPAGALRMVVCHHHLVGAPWRASRKFPLKHRDAALRSFAAAGAELVLGGHIHQSTAVERHSFEATAAGDRRPLVLTTAPGFGRPRPERLGEANGLHVVRWTSERARGRDQDLAVRPFRADRSLRNLTLLGVAIVARRRHDVRAVGPTRKGRRIRSPRGALRFCAAMSGAAVLCALAAGLAAATTHAPIIAFGSERGGPVRIHVLGLRSGEQRVLQSRSAGMDVEPSWSPDGRRLAISTSDLSGQDFDIAIVGANGTGRTRITSGASWDEEPAWSPDGKWIAFGERPQRQLRHLRRASRRHGSPPADVEHLRGHRARLVAGRLPHRLHEPARRLPAPLDDERGRHGRAQAHQRRRLVARVVARRARRSRTSATTRATTRSTRSAPTARASPGSPTTTGIADDSPDVVARLVHARVLERQGRGRGHLRDACRRKRGSRARERCLERRRPAWRP